jgi:hypothetical protein
MDIGVCMSKAVLAHKLAARDESNPEEVWNLSRWPSVLSTPSVHRLFVACEGVWRGYFVLAADATFNPHDRRAPYGLLFDTRSWTRIDSVPAIRFRGFTYDVPKIPSAPPSAPEPDQLPVADDPIRGQ